MKRYMVSLLIAVVVCVPLLSVSAYAKDLNLQTVIPEEYMPSGYITTRVPPKISSDRQFFLFFYDYTSNLYYSVSFNGICVLGDLWGRYSLKFTDPNSIVVRVYPCNGRDVFTVTPDQQFQITIPAGEVKGEWLGAANSQWGFSSHDQFWEDGYFLCVYDQQGKLVLIEPRASGFEGGYVYGEIGGYTKFPDLSLKFQEMNLSMSVQEFAQSHFDYYMVQKEGSVLKTSIDYDLKWSYTDKLNVGGNPVNGYLVSAYIDTSFNKVIVYESGAYYSGSTVVHNVFLIDSDTLLSNNFNRMTLANLNRYLNHFNFDSVFYSSENAQLSEDIAGLGNQMGGFTDSAGGFSSQAGSAVSGVTASVSQFNPLFMGVWNALPPWFLALLSVVLVIVIGRKILGR